MGIVKQQWLEEMDDEEWERNIETDPDMEVFEESEAHRLRRQDRDRLSRHYLLLIEMTTDEYEFRFERRDDAYLLKRWYNGTEWTDRGSMGNVPSWLAPILDVARVSGHIKVPNAPPPDEILWFRTDRECQLTSFIDLEDPV